MKVKDVVVSALNLLGRYDIATSLTDGTELDAEGTEIVNTVLYCFNAVEDEVARKYMPLYAEQELLSPDGDYFYATFAHSPVRIRRVLCDGEEVKYKLFPQFMRVSAKKISVEYEYAPTKKKLEGTSDFNANTGEYLLALGAAAEYCFINGEAEAAEIWEKKYRSEIDKAQSRLPDGGTIPPRRWV